MPRDPRVLVLHELPAETTEGIDDLTDAIRRELPDVRLDVAEDYADGVRRVTDADVVVSHTPTGELLDEADGLRWIQGLSAGVDHYDVDRMREMGIAVTTASGANANAVAETTMGYVLTFERELHHSIRQAREAEWRLRIGGELRDKTVGLLGVGAIGSRVAELADAFDMTVLGMKRNLDDAPAAVDDLFAPDELHALLGRSDYVVVACPLTEETRNLLTIKEFTSMKRDAVLVNVARGEIVNQRHLEAAVQRGFIGGAALDVFETEPLPSDSPLWTHSDVVVTPHSAGASSNYLAGCAEVFAENYRLFVEGRADEMRNRVV
ncbi:D-2-hydroxyacid dehydrogenase [Haloplanus sp. GCM10025708]|uniref:D-2-hydroxyacid dehydrogenase n=1 Tax=Haloferacaceae TaxID=1644056 RepID=UPI00361596AF